MRFHRPTVSILAVSAVAFAATFAIAHAGARDREPAFRDIMVEEGAPSPTKRARKPVRQTEQPQRPDRPRRRTERPGPRGSSTYVPPPVPSPNAANSPPPPSALAPGPGVYQPPRRDSFGDRVTNCIHSAPLNAGVGNNPSDPQAYIRNCAN